MATTSSSSVVAESEEDCANHGFRVQILKTTCNSVPHQRSRLMASLLRAVAINTDGRCATRGAVDFTFTTTGIVFRFTSDEKRDEFIQTIGCYFRDTVLRQLVISKI